MRSTERPPPAPPSRAALPWAWPVALAATVLAMATPQTPLQCSLFPLWLAVWRGTTSARALGMALFLAPAVFLCVWGLVGTGVPPAMALVGAAAFCAAVSAIAAVAGVVAAGALLAAVPFLPMSPVAAVAAGIPGLGLSGLVLAGLALAVAEALRRRRIRGMLVAALAAGGLTAGTLGRAAPDPDGWRELPEPAAVTQRARWIAIRDSIPHGAEAILGENVFDADDAGALAFWCAAAVARGSVLSIGVATPGPDYRRGVVWRLDPEACERPGRPPETVHGAVWGLPHLTGPWGAMPPVDPPARATAVDWLVCLEAFLLRAWAPLLVSGTDRPVVVLSNDAAFGAAAGAVRTLRRKVSSAMAGLRSRAALHAGTGRTFLLRREGRG